METFTVQLRPAISITLPRMLNPDETRKLQHRIVPAPCGNPVQNLAGMRLLAQLRGRPVCTDIRQLTALDSALKCSHAKVQFMPSERCSVYVSMHGRFLLAFCAHCKDFVAASSELGSIAIAARAHRCEATAVSQAPAQDRSCGALAEGHGRDCLTPAISVAAKAFDRGPTVFPQLPPLERRFPAVSTESCRPHS